MSTESIELTKAEAVEILKALSRIEGFIMGSVGLMELEFPAAQLDTCTELLTDKMELP